MYHTWKSAIWSDYSDKKRNKIFIAASGGPITFGPPCIAAIGLKLQKVAQLSLCQCLVAIGNRIMILVNTI